jgi:hypothetical protein
MIFCKKIITSAQEIIGNKLVEDDRRQKSIFELTPIFIGFFFLGGGEARGEGRTNKDSSLFKLLSTFK